MRLITHNLLRCNIKSVGDDGYPLKIEAEKVEVVPSGDYSAAMMASVLKKIDVGALKSAAANLSLPDLQDVVVEEGGLGDELLADEGFLRQMHKLLFEVHVVEGSLVCPVSGRRFPVKDSIPNMLLHEDEV